MLRFGWSALLPAYCYLALLSVPLAWIDALSHRLPDRLTLPSYPIALALLGGAALAVPAGGQHYLHALAGLAACAAFYGVLWLISPASIGLGDVKLAGVLGLYLGWFGARATLAGLLGGFVLAAVVGLMLITARASHPQDAYPVRPVHAGRHAGRAAHSRPVRLTRQGDGRGPPRTARGRAARSSRGWEPVASVQR